MDMTAGFIPLAPQLDASTPTDPTPAARRTPAAPNRSLEADPRLMMAHHPLNPRCERIRMLRTELLLRRGLSERANTIALLSPHAGEGRSLLAAELALAFAETGCPTLLVDGDLRHPHLHRFFGAKNVLGLAQAIETDREPNLQGVQGMPRMSVLTAGVVSGNPLELLTSRVFANMIENWRNNFEFIVIDTAPAGHYSDGLAVASLAGNVLALSRAQHTPYKDMQDMLRRLASTRSEILGAVINHF